MALLLRVDLLVFVQVPNPDERFAADVTHKVAQACVDFVVSPQVL
jgi:hypothetical protein